jgi:hypothetical protein
MSRLATPARLAATAAASGLLAALGLAGAGAASAQAVQTFGLAPGQSACVTQHASYQVRAQGAATADGARFKLLRNGSVLEATSGRVTSWATERRSSSGTFPGAGTYAACAYNTGTRNTTVTLWIYTDSEV